MAFIGALSGSQNQNSGSNVLWGSGTGISGLASGMDTDSMVKGLMQAASLPLVSVLQQRQVLQWQQELYQRVGNSLSSLQSTVHSLQLQSTFMVQTASSSNSSVVTASATPQAPAGSYNVSVSQLAQGSTISSSQVLSVAANFGDTTLATLSPSATDYNITINNESFSFSGTDTINSVLAQISHDPKAGVSAFYDANSGKVVMQTTATGTGATINLTRDDASLFNGVFKIQQAAQQIWSYTPSQVTANGGLIEINGQKIQLTAADMASSTTVMAAINNQSSLVTANPDPSGNGNIVFSSTSSTLLSQISISDPQGILSPVSVPSGAAKDAVFSVNGYESTSTSSSVNYNGITFNLTGVTTSGGNDSPVTITVSKNTDAIVQNIMDFVKQYNSTVQYAQGLYNQKRNLDYHPLTSDQQSQMTQTQVDQWNQKAQSGLLGNDSLLGSALDGLTSAVGTVVGDQGQAIINGQNTTLNSLTAIGIKFVDPINGVDDGFSAPNVTTTGYNTFGLLEINTDTLQQAIQANPDAVTRLFTNTAPPPAGSSSADDTGIGIRLYSSLTTAINNIQQEAGIDTQQLAPSSTTTGTMDILPFTAIDPNGDLSTLFSTDGSDVANGSNLSSIDGSIKDLDSRALDMQNQLQDLKARYQQQFSAMESALANMNSMSSAFNSMLGQTSQGG